MPELLQEMYYGPNVQNLIESDDCKVMRLSDNSGEGMMTLYHVFPGVFLMYNDFHMKECISGFQTDMDLLCIDPVSYTHLCNGQETRHGEISCRRACGL